MDISEDKIVEFETAVRPIPQYDINNPQMISQGPSVCVFNKEDNGEVLASWLFAQYLLTNDVQIAYSGTEGYIPVTIKAQESDVYKDYLAKEGDDEDHYWVKIEAAKLMLDNIGNTFITSVFNGSTSLRTAAGQLIEDTVKAARRKQDMTSDTAIDTEFANVTSLFRLDQKNLQGKTDGKTALGKLPSASVALIVILCVIWAFMIVYVIFNIIKEKKLK